MNISNIIISKSLNYLFEAIGLSFGNKWEKLFVKANRYEAKLTDFGEVYAEYYKTNTYYNLSPLKVDNAAFSDNYCWKKGGFLNPIENSFYQHDSSNYPLWESYTDLYESYNELNDLFESAYLPSPNAYSIATIPMALEPNVTAGVYSSDPWPDSITVAFDHSPLTFLEERSEVRHEIKYRLAVFEENFRRLTNQLFVVLLIVGNGFFEYFNNKIDELKRFFINKKSLLSTYAKIALLKQSSIPCWLSETVKSEGKNGDDHLDFQKYLHSAFRAIGNSKWKKKELEKVALPDHLLTLRKLLITSIVTI